MASPRLSGGASLALSPSIKRSPAVISSSPAMRRSRVDLPQPDGPTNTTKLRSSMSRLIPLMTSNSPKFLRILRSVTVAIPVVPSLDGAEGQATNELALTQPTEDQNRRDRHGRCRGEFGPEQPFGR